MIRQTATWTTVASCAAEQSTDWQNCTLSTPISAPFWRWQITSTWGGDPPRPRELQFNGVTIYKSSTGWTSDPSPSWIVEDLTTGIPYKDVSDLSNPIEYLAGNLMDGSLVDSSRWWPTGSFTEWSVVFDFRQGDSLALLDTCATASNVDLAEAVARNSTEAIASFSTYGRSLTIITSPGGSYRLCWCSRGFDCSRPQAFAVDMGAITILGPHAIDAVSNVYRWTTL